ncbi:uncharacterized protein LOC131214693, partial [Anopheles bellator]|uniref:uncharacterized protein LOC131214693 n=1 Tax=Anopheles bellator TaxID=139047 RepID=UPI002648D2DE
MVNLFVFAVLLVAADLTAKRSQRQIWLSPRASNWKQALGDGSPCLTAKGLLGSCTSFRKCYPYFKVPDLNVWDSWVLGNYDTCSYFNDDGRQAFGVCCTNPITPLPIDVSNVVGEDPRPGLKPTTSPVAGGLKPPNKNNNYPSWPPPIPTHPPDHTPATHPPSLGGPPTTVSSVIASEPTQRPTTTWPTRPRPPQVPNQPPPSVGAWPPPVPTHPPPFEISTIPPSQPVAGDPVVGGCGLKNGNP